MYGVKKFPILRRKRRRRNNRILQNFTFNRVFFLFVFKLFSPQKINYLIEAFLKMYFLLCLQGHFTYMLVLKKSHEKLGKICIEFFIFGNGLQAVAFTNWTARV